MKILILNGSPRLDGNTITLLNQIADNAKATYKIEFINVCSKKLLGCIACDKCAENNGNCILPDDTSDIINKIVESDMIIFGTPVYWWGMSSQLKVVIDKFYSSQDKIKGKKIGLVVVGANELNDAQYRLISEQFSCIANYLDLEIVFDEKVSAYERGEVKSNKAILDKFANIGKTL